MHVPHTVHRAITGYVLLSCCANLHQNITPPPNKIFGVYTIPTPGLWLALSWKLCADFYSIAQWASCHKCKGYVLSFEAATALHLLINHVLVEIVEFAQQLQT